MQIWTTLVGFASGFLSAVFAEPLRQWVFRARLKLDFENNDYFVTSTDEGDPPTHKAHYIRVRVANRSARVAKGCRAYLVGLDRLGTSGAWEPTEYCECLQLAWSRGRKPVILRSTS
jgi:hypothetical protein